MPDVFERGRHGVENITYWLFNERIIEQTKCDEIFRARSTRETQRRVVNAILTAGYDGIVYENEHEGGTTTTNEDSYIVFFLEQIKSIFDFVSGNRNLANFLASSSIPE